MPGNKPHSEESVRDRWARQRKESAESGSPASAQRAPGAGSHFAQSRAARQAPAGGSSGPAARVAYPSARAGEAERRPAEAAPGGQRRARIAGVSGELPKVPVRVKRSAAVPYSRYNLRYRETEGAAGRGQESLAQAWVQERMEGAPALGWKAFAVYGAVSAAACAVWCLVAKLSSAEPPVPGDPSLTVGIALLVLIVAGGVAVAAATTALTRRRHEEVALGDALASALGKTALMMIGAAVVWVAAMAAVTYAGA